MTVPQPIFRYGWCLLPGLFAPALGGGGTSGFRESAG